MGLPKLTVKLFPPKPGKSYASSGSLTISLSDVHALAEWLLGQQGEYDNYLQQHVVKLLAFEYNNTSRGGNTYRTVQLRDPADLDSGHGRHAAGRGSLNTPPPQWEPRPEQGDDYDSDEIPF